MEFRCWLCDDGHFSTALALKRHLAGPTHMRLHVTCPWCCDVVKNVRVWDIKRHVDKVHPGMDMLVPGELFKEPTLFYFAMHPVDYARVIRPTPLEHPNAGIAMTAMRSLLNSRPSGDIRTKEQWEEGWLQAMGTPLTSERPEHMPTSMPCYVPSMPVYVPTGFGAQCMPTPNVPTQSESATVPEAYSPTRPSLTDAIEVISVDVEPESVQLKLLRNYSACFRVTLTSSICREESTIMRLRDIVHNPLDYIVDGATSPVQSKEYTDMVDLITEKIGLSETCVDAVDRYLAPPTRRPILQPLMVQENHPPPTSRPILQPRRVQENHPPPTSRPILQPRRAQENHPPPPAPASSSTPAEKTPSPEEASRNCAKTMLAQGVMPLIPPAPRQWTSDEVVVFHGEVNSVKWPPKGWKDLSPSRRRQAFEFSAMLLDVGRSGFPETDSKFLLAKYNFLCLPGSQRGDSTSSNQQMLFSNFNALRKMATGREQNPSLLRMYLDAAKSRDTSSDHYVRAMDEAQVPLRLEA